MLSKFDVFPKFADKSVNIQTFTGGLISFLTTLWVCFLLVGKIHGLIYPEIKSSVVLDKEHVDGQRKTFINFDITIGSPCTMLHIDLFEHDGYQKTNIIENISLTRYAQSGEDINDLLEKRVPSKSKKQDFPPDYCGNCYLSTDKKCCNTCREVMDVFKAKGLTYYASFRWEQCIREGVLDFGNETCRIKGKLKVKKQSGNFHIALGANTNDNYKGHSHDLSSVDASHKLNHVIHSLTFGEPVDYYKPQLTDVEMQLPELNGSNYWMVTYYLHAAPERISTTDKIDSYRYSAFPSRRKVTNKTKKGFPGIVFYYDFAPMIVVYQPTHGSIRSIIVDICGIVGGAFSFAAIIDALAFGALSGIRGKTMIGKAA
ncbi:hypothetical protein TVAG_172950 [Trichomonas vaginalis G3]|uniref:Endoplasmic reticulum-Golgi intermediate compartment protein 3 n=1 Tax=Trichomonas vaginalis (strain ATCC PRA-98 / G3) TaxID=412133 RepID=A2DF45_TRIV3|nr:vesicle-mediated transport [Trichomonas vaginalis G3]EAY21037.1 hypothetical protein TVAG_172950 [Trichomonas vaginalis G3]KAI5519213.1 vesicle-mediated transport [Trichomonas vaginalis G3]|eukprot:XP_001582023.1 hypothetical protein [Trichomonas vaginalis G3]